MYLLTELKSAIKRVARQRGVSEAEVIRDSIRQAVGDHDPPGWPLREPRSIAREADEKLPGSASGDRRHRAPLLAFFETAARSQTVSAVLDGPRSLSWSRRTWWPSSVTWWRLGSASRLSSPFCGGWAAAPGTCRGSGSRISSARAVVERYDDRNVGVADARTWSWPTVTGRERSYARSPAFRRPAAARRRTFPGPP